MAIINIHDQFLFVPMNTFSGIIDFKLLTSRSPNEHIERCWEDFVHANEVFTDMESLQNSLVGYGCYLDEEPISVTIEVCMTFTITLIGRVELIGNSLIIDRYYGGNRLILH